MDKQLIERIALEVCDPLDARKIGTYGVCEFATRFLARIDAERGKDATAWRILDKSGETLRLSESSADVRFCQAEGFLNVPLFLSPTTPEGMALICFPPTDKIVAAFWGEVEHGDIELAHAWNAYFDLIAAAQGERNAD